MRKRNVLFLSIFLVIFTAVSTWFIAMFYTVEIDKGVVLTSQKYQNLESIKNKYSTVEYLINYVKTNFYKEVSEEQILEGIKKGIFESLDDPYSVFLNQDEFQALKESTSGTFAGIGIYVGANDQKQIIVIAPIEDTPAHKAGLLSNDVILKVNGTEYSSDSLDEATKNIKGLPGTPVTLTILRDTETFDVEIFRDWIDVKVVKTEIMNGDIGYLKLTVFDEGSAEEFKTGIESLISDGAKKLILDLRGNPGGSLLSCIEIADMLLGKADVLYTKTRNGEDATYTSDAFMYDLPLVVLVNEGSASASEILSGAIKDLKRGTIIGEQTFGKGLVQTVIPYAEGTGIKLTTAEYFTPNHISINGVGVTPDVVVPQEAVFEVDEQLEKALEVLQ